MAKFVFKDKEKLNSLLTFIFIFFVIVSISYGLHSLVISSLLYASEDSQLYEEYWENVTESCNGGDWRIKCGQGENYKLLNGVEYHLDAQCGDIYLPIYFIGFNSEEQAYSEINKLKMNGTCSLYITPKVWLEPQTCTEQVLKRRLIE